jgi:uncharacterized protein
VRARLGSTAGTVRGHVLFRRESGLVVAALEVSGAVELVCQRCLRSMPWKIDGSALVALIANESQVDRVPEQLEPMLAPGGKVSLRDLVEEEVMLSLPIVALHEEAIACNPLVAVAEDDEDRNVQRPFEQLGELLKRSSEASSACEEKDNGRSKKS